MFTLQLSKICASRLLRPLALLAIAAVAAPGTALANSPWASVGSTGIVDESCYLAVQMDNSEARVMPGLLVPCKVRYQVTDTFGTATGIVTGQALFAHIRDTSATPGKVVVRLLAYPNTGAAPAGILIASIDSDTTPGGTPIGATGFTRYRNVPATFGCGATLNFTANTYWIEVDMTGGIPPTMPGLAIGSLQLRNCFP